MRNMIMALVNKIIKYFVVNKRPDGAVAIGSSSFFAVPLPYLRFCSPLPDFYKKFSSASPEMTQTRRL